MAANSAGRDKRSDSDTETTRSVRTFRETVKSSAVHPVIASILSKPAGVHQMPRQFVRGERLHEGQLARGPCALGVGKKQPGYS